MLRESSFRSWKMMENFLKTRYVSRLKLLPTPDSLQVKDWQGKLRALRVCILKIPEKNIRISVYREHVV